ncbi:ABC transporter permease subunit [Tahibacter amnicola]|uniref:ABC transporter permease subunit n=1 Tax=Tahibacter amnicola TaxID=2976241 RepID=A0ABY6BLU9_9GAMM|nr:ABC transporter permease subunit [Tahibacter amnicola]UXI70606.1 ABC transporter permease subunit [Tahibacter amnicola]
MRWLGLFATRLAGGLLTLWLLVTLCFALLHAAPGGPFDTEKAAPPAVQAQLAARYRLDQPLSRQYLAYLGDLARGDLGPSFQYPDFTVNALIAASLPVSAGLGGAALLLALLLGVPIGVFAAAHEGGRLDRLLMALTATLSALPKFVLAPILILLFAVTLKWLPAGGWVAGDWRYRVLPIVALMLPNLAWCARLTRAGVCEALGSEWVRAARGRGIGRARLLLVHALPAALLPVTAWLSPALIAVITGSAVVEHVFGIPGMGRYFVQGALNRDYTLVMGVVVIAGALVIVANTLVDGLRAWLDPRLRTSA